MVAPCPFCGTETTESTCPGCHRSLVAPRRVCEKCGKLSPVAERECCHCREPFRSELRWKIPLIIALFVLAFGVAVLIHLVAG